jgi:hypothetical protein
MLGLKVVEPVIRKNSGQSRVGVLELGLGLVDVALGQRGLGLAKIVLDRLSSLDRPSVIGVKDLGERPERVARLGIAGGHPEAGERDRQYGGGSGDGDEQTRPALSLHTSRVDRDGRELGVDEVFDGRRVDVATPGEQQFGQLVVTEPAERTLPVIEVGTGEHVEILVIGVHEREVDGLVLNVGELRLGVISSILHSDHLLR